MRPVSPTSLYWSDSGEVACAKHAPQAENPRWSREGWAAFEVLSGNVHGTLYEYQCQHCAPDGLPVEREARLSEILERLWRHDDQAYAHLQRAEYHQLAAERHIELARRKKADGRGR